MQPREQDWNVHQWNGNRNRASPTCPASTDLNAGREREHTGNTTREVSASASAAQAGCGMEWRCSFLAPFLPRVGGHGALGAATHPQPPFSFQLLNFSIAEKNPNWTSPNPADYPSTQQASTAAITLTASHEIPSELEFWLHWLLTHHIKVLTYAFVPIFVPPHNVSFRFHCLVYFLIKDFDILKPFYISYPGNIQRGTTQMGK